jgi:hypothetical protein
LAIDYFAATLIYQIFVVLFTYKSFRISYFLSIIFCGGNKNKKIILDVSVATGHFMNIFYANKNFFAFFKPTIGGF